MEQRIINLQPAVRNYGYRFPGASSRSFCHLVKQYGLCETPEDKWVPTSTAAVCLPLMSAPFALAKDIIRPSFLSGYPLLTLVLAVFMTTFSFPVGKRRLYIFTEAKRNLPLWSGVCVWQEFLLLSKINVSKKLSQTWGQQAIWIVRSASHSTW